MRIGAGIIGLAIGLAGCVTEGGDFSTLTQAEVDVVTRSANASVPTEEGGFELDAYKNEQAEADRAGEGDDPDDLAAELGAEGVDVPSDPPVAPTPVGPPLVAPGYPPYAGSPYPPPQAVAPPPSRWTPANPVTLSWGVRLVSTVDSATPPRAILGMPDGSEEVVKAGDLLPEVGVVVLAVGQGVVQLGRVQPNGDHAEVESVFLSAMFGEPRVAPVP